MAPRSLHPTHPTDVKVTESAKHVDFQPVCRCGPIGDRIRLSLPHRPKDRIAAYEQALGVVRRHEQVMGVHDRQWATSAR